MNFCPNSCLLQRFPVDHTSLQVHLFQVTSSTPISFEPLLMPLPTVILSFKDRRFRLFHHQVASNQNVFFLAVIRRSRGLGPACWVPKNLVLHSSIEFEFRHGTPTRPCARRRSMSQVWWWCVHTQIFITFHTPASQPASKPAGTPASICRHINYPRVNEP
jgi:hypothetical protein